MIQDDDLYARIEELLNVVYDDNISEMDWRPSHNGNIRVAVYENVEGN